MTKLNRVIASAPVAGQLEIIENFVLQVDGTGAKGGRSKPITTVNITSVFRIKSLDLAAIQQAVSNATTDQLADGANQVSFGHFRRHLDPEPDCDRFSW